MVHFSLVPTDVKVFLPCDALIQLRIQEHLGCARGQVPSVAVMAEAFLRVFW